MGKSNLDHLCENVVALRELAIQAALLGKTSEAVELWGKFIALKQNIPEAFVYLENLLVQSPGFLPGLFVLAAAHICSGQREKGLKSLNGLSRMKMGPSLVAICNDLAKRLTGENRSDWATSLIESVVKDRTLAFP